MPLIKISITKAADFQNKREEFSNVYTFDVPNRDVGPMESLIQRCMDAERAIFASTVQMLRGYAYVDKSIAGWFNARLMYAERTWTGVFGTNTPGPMYREAALLVKWPLHRKVTDFGSISRKRSLKKYLHLCTNNGMTPGQASGSESFDTGEPGYVREYINYLMNAPNAALCSQDGSKPSGPAVLHPYVEHRQFPRGRKEYP